MSETSTAPRASSSRPSRRGVTRLMTTLVVVSCIGALSSVVTASLAVQSFLESRRLRAQLDAVRTATTAIDEPIASALDLPPQPLQPPPQPRLPLSAWDALAPTTPVVIDDAELNDMNKIAMSARIVPAFENGKNVGVKLFAIRKDSFFGKLGFQNGDVVRRVAGYELSSPERGLELYTKLKDTTELRVDVERRGEPIRLDFLIR